jgi:hypothetical protein
MLYPGTVSGHIRKHAGARGLDPDSCWRLCGRNRRFVPRCQIHVAARGLMQFISSTSERIARELEPVRLRTDELYDPHTSILFGSQYLADLFLYFPRSRKRLRLPITPARTTWRVGWPVRGPICRNNMFPRIAYAQSKGLCLPGHVKLPDVQVAL